MVVENPKNRIDGSAALAPQTKPLPREREKQDNHKAKREAIKKANRAKLKIFMKFNGSVLAAGVIGIFIISRYSAIYDNQKTINTLKDNIVACGESSEDLSIKLMKFNNISYVEETATNNLSMIKADSTNAIYYDLEAEKFLDPKTQEQSSNGENFISKIKEILFK